MDDIKRLDLSPGNNILEQLKVKCLIVTGPMVNSMAEEFICKLNDMPGLNSIDELRLRVNTAYEDSMPYSGVVEEDIMIPCFRCSNACCINN